MEQANAEKALGTKAFQAKDFPTAITHFTNAIGHNPNDHTLYGNRSACYYNSGEYPKAADDAENAIKIKPDWARGW